LITNIRAGRTPAKRALGPSCRSKSINVLIVDARDFLEGAPGNVSCSDSDLRAVILVFTTHIGFVMRTVALPAMAPAIIDSDVVSFFEDRPARAAAFSKAERVHSYQ
jgi:hypothetical protein